MEFRQRGLIHRQIIENSADDESLRRELCVKYPLALLFFKYPPTDFISLQEFEDFAAARLKVLKIVEKTRMKLIMNSDKYRDAFFAELRKEDLKGFVKTTPELDDDGGGRLIDYQDRRRDHISHFILRLAYCKTEELRRWFIRQEVDLFMIKFKSESRKTIKNWLEYNKFNFEPISVEERTRIHDFVRFNPIVWLSENTDFFKVPFTDVLELVRKRNVYMERGFAYVKIKDLSYIAATQFRMHLTKEMESTARILPSIDEDKRLVPILNNLPVSYLGNDFSSSKKGFEGGHVTRHMLDGLSDKSFPPCMRQLHVALRQNHHLRHQGRLQYLLFLKGIGMSLEEVMQFWREEFTRIVDLDKFDRQYGYTVRHSFGKEGKRTNYTPYSCMKIIMGNNPSVGEHHGCPFRHSDAVFLKQKLQSYKVTPSAVKEIMELSASGHYQLACSRYYLAKNGTALKQTVSHPNQYFVESFKMPQNEGTETNKQNVKSNVVPVTKVYASQMSSKGCNSQTSESSSMDVGDDCLEFADEFDKTMDF